MKSRYKNTHQATCLLQNNLKSQLSAFNFSEDYPLKKGKWEIDNEDDSDNEKQRTYREYYQTVMEMEIYGSYDLIKHKTS